MMNFELPFTGRGKTDRKTPLPVNSNNFEKAAGMLNSCGLLYKHMV